jgi:hypothetical protein
MCYTGTQVTERPVIEVNKMNKEQRESLENAPYSRYIDRTSIDAAKVQLEVQKGCGCVLPTVMLLLYSIYTVMSVLL